MVAKTVIDIGIASNPGSGIYDQIVRVSPLHIVRIENLQAGQGILCILRYCVSRRYFPELRCQRGWTDHAHFALREWNLNPLGAEGIKNVELDLPGGGCRGFWHLWVVPCTNLEVVELLTSGGLDKQFQNSSRGTGMHDSFLDRPDAIHLRLDEG